MYDDATKECTEFQDSVYSKWPWWGISKWKVWTLV